MYSTTACGVAQGSGRRQLGSSQCHWWSWYVSDWPRRIRPPSLLGSRSHAAQAPTTCNCVSYIRLEPNSQRTNTEGFKLFFHLSLERGERSSLQAPHRLDDMDQVPHRRNCHGLGPLMLWRQKQPHRGQSHPCTDVEFPVLAEQLC